MQGWESAAEGGMGSGCEADHGWEGRRQGTCKSSSPALWKGSSRRSQQACAGVYAIRESNTAGSERHLLVACSLKWDTHKLEQSWIFLKDMKKLCFVFWFLMLVSSMVLLKPTGNEQKSFKLQKERQFPKPKYLTFLDLQNPTSVIASDSPIVNVDVRNLCTWRSFSKIIPHAAKWQSWCWMSPFAQPANSKHLDKIKISHSAKT